MHGFLVEVDGVDFAKKVCMGIRNNRYEVDCPIVTGQFRRCKFVHEKEVCIVWVAMMCKFKFILFGLMMLIDMLADGFYGDRVKMVFVFVASLSL